MNSFIETFFDIIIDALQNMHAEFKEKAELLNMAKMKLNHDPVLRDEQPIVKDLFFVLAQHYFFDHGRGLTVRELADIVSKSEPTIRKVIKQLIALSFVEQQGEKPAYYRLNSSYLDS